MHVFPPKDIVHTLSGTRFDGKRARSLFNSISLTDDTEIKEQNTSIATGLFYVQPKFSTLVHGEMLNCRKDILFSVTCNFYSDKNLLCATQI